MIGQQHFHFRRSFQLVHFVEDHERRFARRANFFQHRIHRGDLFVGLRLTDVHHMDQEVGLDDFFERSFECLDQPMRQLADETDRVCQEHTLVRRQAQAPRRRIERREQFVLGQCARAGELIQQRRLSGVGVPHD